MVRNQSHMLQEKLNITQKYYKYSEPGDINPLMIAGLGTNCHNV